jgi:hypothetical protein
METQGIAFPVMLWPASVRHDNDEFPVTQESLNVEHCVKNKKGDNIPLSTGENRTR